MRTKLLFKISFLVITLFLLTININATSPDHWAHIGGGSRSGYSVIEFINGRFISFESSGVDISIDGVNWEYHSYYTDTTPYGAERYEIRGVAYGSGKYVAAGTVYKDYAGNNGVIYVSTDDGSTWIEVGQNLEGYITELNGVAYGNDTFVIVGDRSSVISCKKNNLTGDWTRTSLYPQGPSTLNSVIFVNGQFVAVGDGGMVVTSTDGIVWERIKTPTAENLNDVAYGNNWYIAVADNGTTLRSTDLYNWEFGFTGIDKNINTICYGNNVFITGSDSEIIQSSTEGSIWFDEAFEKNNKNHPSKFYSSAYGNNIFILNTYECEYYTTEPLLPAESPSKLIVTSQSDTELYLSWQDNSQIELYFVIWRKSEGGTYKFLTYVPANTPYFVDKGLKPLTTYSYKVGALSIYGYSTYTTSGEGTTKMFINTNPIVIDEPQIIDPIVIGEPQITIVLSPPKAPSSLEVSSSIGSSARLIWKDNASNESFYKIERKDATGVFAEIAVLDSDTTEYVDYGLDYGETYTYRVRAYNYKGNSDYSNEAGVTMRSSIYIIPKNIIEIPITIPSDTLTSPEQPETTTNGETTEDEIVLKIGQQEYVVNGVTYTMDTSPLIQNNRTIMPIRYIIEALGGSVVWDNGESKVTISLNGNTICLWIDNSIATVNGIGKYIDSENYDVKPVILPPGRTMIPIRFVIEQLGCGVQWIKETKEIIITK